MFTQTTKHLVILELLNSTSNNNDKDKDEDIYNKKINFALEKLHDLIKYDLPYNSEFITNIIIFLMKNNEKDKYIVSNSYINQSIFIYH